VSSPRGRTVGDALDEATRRLSEARIPDPRRDAATIFAFALGTDRGGVAARAREPIDPAQWEQVAGLISGRARRVPLQHLTGFTEFHGLEFEVGPDVLIPRPETEDLVEAVLGAVPSDAALVADLGTGSGCVAIALAVARPAWRVTAVDLSADALRVAARNASRHGVADRVALVARDFVEVPAGDRRAYDVVVSNPPYVSEEEWRTLQPEVRDHEPRMALVSGPNGDEAYRAVVAAASAMLCPEGVLALELGWKSEEAVRGIVAAQGFGDVVIRPDFQGIARILTAVRR